MPATFLHTADWQLGKPFAGVADEEKRALVRQARLEAVERAGAVARERGAEFILVAGDLFDSPSPARETVSAACAAIGAMRLPVFTIPGNHDFAGPGSVWEQPFFQRERDHLAPNLTLLLAPEPVELETAVIFPCPLLRRHESSDTTTWARSAAADAARFGDKPRILLAHGSVHGFGSEGAMVNRLDLARLPDGAFDYIALGDWHGTKQAGPGAWYAGTPERDRFPRGEGNDPGHVLLVSATRGGAPSVSPEATARLRWHRLEFEFAGDDSLPQLEEKVSALIGARAREDLLLLELRGGLGIAASASLEEKLDAWRSRLLRLKLDDRSSITPSPAEQEALTQRGADPLIARVAASLLERAAGDTEEAAIARLALCELHAAAR